MINNTNMTDEQTRPNQTRPNQTRPNQIRKIM